MIEYIHTSKTFSEIHVLKNKPTCPSLPACPDRQFAAGLSGWTDVLSPLRQGWADEPSESKALIKLSLSLVPDPALAVFAWM